MSGRSQHKCPTTEAGVPATNADMDDLTNDDLILDAVDTVVLDVLDRIRDDPDARYAFFRRLLALAQQATRADQCPPE